MELVLDAVLVALVLAFGARFLRNLTKSDEAWYNSRALAESVQSQIWRYVMDATPYRPNAAGDVGNAPTQTPEMQLADRIRALRSTSSIDLRISANAPVEQITRAMKRVHDASLQERMGVYTRNRLIHQRKYYQRKASQYGQLARNWNIVIFVVEAIAVLASAGRFVGLPSISLYGVVGTAVAGIAAWLQMKQYSTLERRYTQMVRNLQEYLDVLSIATDPAKVTPDGWSTFVDQVEQLLEHEHGSWLHLYQGLHNQQAPQQATLQEVAQRLAPGAKPPHLP